MANEEPEKFLLEYLTPEGHWATPGDAAACLFDTKAEALGSIDALERAGYGDVAARRFAAGDATAADAPLSVIIGRP